MKYIYSEKLIAEIERQEIGYNTDGKHTAEYNTCRKILDIITSLQQEQPGSDEEEKSWSLQIQAYLTTASDELYAPGKPLYTKEHHEGIHKCMKMWQKLHKYYFSTKHEQPDVELEKEIAFRFNGKEVSWDELPIEVRKHDYPYYFDGDIDCYPFKIENKQ